MACYQVSSPRRPVTSPSNLTLICSTIMDRQKPGRDDLVATITSILRANTTAGGLSVAVGCVDKPFFNFCTGQADILAGTPIAGTPVFGIGSITKIFVAVVILQLVEEGRLHLEDPVEKHLAAEIYDGIEDARTATLAQLLNHTAGIDSWEDEPEWIIDGRGKNVRPDYVWEKTEPLRYLRRPKRTAPSPGHWAYSNTHYTLLALIIEKVTQNHAENEIRRRIIDPLGLRNTYTEGFETPRVSGAQTPCRYHLATPTFRETAGVCAAFPQIQDGLIEATNSNLSVSWLAGGIMSTTTDLLQFAFALRDGRLLGPLSMSVLRDVQPTTKEHQEMGHGVFRINPSGEQYWLGHFGGVLGFSSGLWWLEGEDCAVCVLTNVGHQHAGVVKSSVAGIVLESDFLKLASELVKS